MSEQKQQTLIEKLERERNGKARLAEYYKTVALEHLVHGLDAAIGIVKQHQAESGWVSVDERLPPEEIKLLFEHEDYGIIVGYYKDKGEFVTYDTHYNYREPISRFIKCCYIPPSEAQEKIYGQEMDKINFCGCGCILPDGLTRCSDCEALYD